jgi:hypothetical protein
MVRKRNDRCGINPDRQGKKGGGVEVESLAATALLAKNLSIKRNRYHQGYNKKYPPHPYWQPRCQQQA